MAQLALKMALSHYERHIPFFDGTVRPEGIDLTVLEVGESIPLKHGSDRHGRMLQHGEFDICEVVVLLLSYGEEPGDAVRGGSGFSAPSLQPVANVGQRQRAMRRK